MRGSWDNKDYHSEDAAAPHKILETLDGLKSFLGKTLRESIGVFRSKAMGEGVIGEEAHREAVHGALLKIKEDLEGLLPALLAFVPIFLKSQDLNQLLQALIALSLKKKEESESKLEGLEEDLRG